MTSDQGARDKQADQVAKGNFIAQAKNGAKAIINVFQTAQNQTSDHEQRNRRRMIEKVRSFWIRDVLEKSLYREARLPAFPYVENLSDR